MQINDLEVATSMVQQRLTTQTNALEVARAEGEDLLNQLTGAQGEMRRMQARAATRPYFGCYPCFGQR